MKKLRRLWNSHAPPWLKRGKNLAFLTLSTVIIFCMVDLFKSQRNFLTCSSDINLAKADYFEQYGIQIIPSSPGNQSLLHGNPEMTSECVSVLTPDNAHSLITCIHNPNKDLMLSAHIKVCTFYLNTSHYDFPGYFLNSIYICSIKQLN